jgi:autotransporter-associated beta strand protein
VNYISTSASLSWDDASGPTPSDGKTWDIQNNTNWNNGSVATVYSDCDSVTFNDSNNGDYNVTLSTTVSPGSVTVKNSSGNYVFSGSGGIAGGAALSKSGSDTLTLDTANSFTGGVTVSAGTLVAGVSGALPDGTVKITGGTLRLGTNTGNPTVSSLSISSGEMDIGNNTLFITYGSSDPISTIAGYIKTGFNSGNWNGTGIISSSARTTTNGLKYGVGWADGKDNVVSGLNSGTIELKYTLLGDANLDGTVNGSDFSIMAANFGTGATNWDQGNFLYTSSVNGTDFSALAVNFGAGVSGADGEAGEEVTQSDVAALDAFAAANGLEADVPEPGSGVAILAGAAVLGRRKRVR